MQLYSTFENTIYLEMVIATLEKRGITKENIYAVPLDIRMEERKLFDTIHRSDGTSMIDVGIALATVFSVVGTSIGFKLAWGPIISGVLSGFLGFFIGVAIRLFTEKVLKKRKRLARGKNSEVILIINCEETKAELVENILWEHLALGVAKVK
ncbi:hypothetical protein [Paenisporosarcina sp. TG20]|uniref:hypothetical protein n=1 Tax=Paenisporosarcina sp. TG20 TaxID=1211706 RepID=UPI0002E7D5D5|nr:hypothetical protein [Paenisporosarcina sp. TG20]